MLGRQKILNRNAQMRKLKDEIELPRNSRGHIRTQSDIVLFECEAREPRAASAQFEKRREGERAARAA